MEPQILDAEISYDFGLVKRDSGDIYIRIDYSNSQGYWDSIVQGDPALSERFYSASASDRKAKFDALRKVDYPPLVFLGQGSLNKNNFDILLSGETAEKCPSSSGDDGFLKMDISGWLHEELEFGYMFIGMISPTFSIQEAYGYYDISL